MAETVQINNFSDDEQLHVLQLFFTITTIFEITVRLPISLLLAKTSKWRDGLLSTTSSLEVCGTQPINSVILEYI